MTAAGWHPDPTGRADRRYHDGTRWTEHVADTEGATAEDPEGADPAAPAPPLVIGPPPPRTGPEQPPASPPVADDAPGPQPLPSARGSRTDEMSPAEAAAAEEPRTQRLTPEDLAAATASSPAAPPAARPVDHTVVMSSEDVEAAAALAAAPPPVGATAARHTEPLSPADLAAAAALADGGAPAEPAPERPRARRPPVRASVPGLVLALVGTAVGLVGLLALPWGRGPGADPSYLDWRELVDGAGPDIGLVPIAFVLTGALFAIGVGGVAALARAAGAAPVRAVAGAVVVVGTAGLAVLGYVAIDVDRAPTSVTTEVGPSVGAPVTLPDGSPVTDPSSGEPVIVPEGAAGTDGLTEEQVVGAVMAQGEDRLTEAAAVGTGILVVAGVLLALGLALDRPAGHVITALGLLVAAGWAGATVVLVRGSTQLGDPGLGLYAVAAATVVLAAGAAVPGWRRRDPTPGPS